MIDPAVLARRRERATALGHRRRRARTRIVAGAGVVCVAVAGLLLTRSLLDLRPAQASAPAVAPVHLDIGPPPPPVATAAAESRAAPARTRRPVVWIQAGHAPPREPGYAAQTGAGSGPFGSEIGFTTALAPKLVARLRRAGVDARLTPGLVTPRAAGGAAFMSLHHDTPEGAAAIGHAITGAGENYYHGEGTGDPSPLPYSDSAPHRPATTVSTTVERRSRALAARVSRSLRAIYTPANGARARYRGVETREGNPRLMRYYGFYRTRAEARIIVEAGAGTTDDEFLRRTSLIADTLSAAIIRDLRARGLLARPSR